MRQQDEPDRMASAPVHGQRESLSLEDDDSVSLDDIDAELGDLPIQIAGTDMPVEVVPTTVKCSPQNERPGTPHEGMPKLRPFEEEKTVRHEDTWKRTPNVTGQGAIHCKTFHCKLSADSLHYIDEQINHWLDDHPQYEVKFVTTSVGDWGGKMGTETHLVVQVWV